ncbi:MAG TPA: FIST N-terminal domain-containing protein [Lachnospiraceae bacterium]|nr:FIST N-terminal domain-containing protein [Lachnospiraceae bacterium]
MKFNTYHSESGSVQSNVNEAKQILGNPTFLIYTASYEEIAEYAKELKRVFPDSKQIGATGITILNQGYQSSGLAVMAFDDSFDVEVGILEDVDKYPIKYIKELEDAVRKVKPERNNSICFELCTHSEERIVTTMNVILEKLGIPLIGGTAGNTPQGSEKMISLDGMVYQNCVVFAVLKYRQGKIKVVKENIFKPSKEQYIATKVDSRARKIIELNHKKATTVYADALGIKETDITKKALTNPLCRTIGKEHYICAIHSINQDGSINTYKNIQENDVIQFMEVFDNVKQSVIDTMEQARKELGHISGMITINCILRYLYFEKEHFIKEYTDIMAGYGTHFGIVGDGEQFINQHINQTMVGIIFG